MDISVREAEQRLDAKLFLDKIPRWHPGGPHHALLYQKMFEHVRAASLMEYHHGIHLGHWQPSPEKSPQVGVSAMGLLTPETMLDEILVFYQEVYQLKRDPGEVQCSAGAAEEAHIEILDVLKVCLWHRQGSSWPDEPRWTPRMQTEVKYHDQTKATCGYFSSFQTWQQQPREEALRVAREAHHQMLVAVAMLEGILNTFTAPPPTGNARAGNILSVTSTWGADSTQEVGGVPGVEGSVGVIEGERLHQRVQAVGIPLPPA